MQTRDPEHMLVTIQDAINQEIEEHYGLKGRSRTSSKNNKESIDCTF